ncbi:MAG: FAD-dependent oxidoreductase, partial [Pseudomonadota bacterium]
ALPPRLAAGLAFAPALPEPAAAALRGAPGWMAAQAKLVAVYPAPFWRAAGLSGDAISHRGPLAEIHDASPLAASPGALFGFLGVPPQARAADPEALKSACLAQLARLFGPEAAAPDAVLFKDWAADPATAAPRDLSEPPRHPPGGLPPLSGPWSGRLRFAGSEHADPASGAAPGYVEGALAAGEAAADAAAAALAPGGPARP